MTIVFVFAKIKHSQFTNSECMGPGLIKNPITNKNSKWHLYAWCPKYNCVVVTSIIISPKLLEFETNNHGSSLLIT